MSLFSRRRTADVAGPAEDAPAPEEAVAISGPGADAGRADAGRAGAGRGPWDVAEVSGPGTRLDLGAVWVPARPGVHLRIEMDRTSSRMVAVNLGLAGSVLQIQAFAAPRTEGIWDELRSEIAASVTQQGGTAEDVTGPFGRELLARLPMRAPDGRTGTRPARFIGVDGPRWFLRGVLTGRAAVDPDSAVDLEEIFADVVVVRGHEARPPRGLLPLHPPGVRPAPAPEPTGALPDVLTRGPEITEVR